MQSELVRAMEKEMKKPGHIFPTALSGSEYESFKRAERQHTPGVACRMNPNTFRIEYYETKTGNIVSSHI